MAPRISCLRAVQDVVPKYHRFGSPFSTAQRAMADPPSESSSILSVDKPHPATRVGIKLPPSRPSGPQSLIQASRVRQLNLLNLAKRKDTTNENNQFKLAQDMSKQIKRRWQEGEIYAPHDLSPEEMEKWKRRRTPDYDVFDILDMNPIDEYKNFSIMSEFMTPMGRIKGSQETGLRPVNQRKIAKAIRRTIGLGMMPSVHRHPEILMKQSMRRNEQQSPNQFMSRNPQGSFS